MYVFWRVEGCAPGSLCARDVTPEIFGTWAWSLSSREPEAYLSVPGDSDFTPPLACRD